MHWRSSGALDLPDPKQDPWVHGKSRLSEAKYLPLGKSSDTPNMEKIPQGFTGHVSELAIGPDAH